jgi:hypothetical protein
MKYLRKFITITVREYLNENIQNYKTVYRGQPIDEFITFLQSKGYDGFMNGDNILIFDKSLLK